MKLFNKILCVLLLMVMMITFAACNDNSNEGKLPSANIDTSPYGEVEGYYSSLAYEVVQENGDVDELMFFLHDDAEMLNPVGLKEVIFDENGEVAKYTISIGTEYMEKYMTYVKNSNGEYYSEIEFSAENVMSSSKWENISVDAESGDISKSIGNQTFYENGKVKTEYHELYINDVLSSTTIKEYDENGELISETVK